MKVYDIFLLLSPSLHNETLCKPSKAHCEHNLLSWEIIDETDLTANNATPQEDVNMDILYNPQATGEYFSMLMGIVTRSITQTLSPQRHILSMI